MSLLDQLAFYSCKFDSLFPELTHSLPNHPKNTKNDQNNYHIPKIISDISEQYCSTNFNQTASVSILGQDRIEETNTTRHAILIQKCSRLSCIGSMMQKKVLKLKYELLVYLSNLKTKKSFQAYKQNKGNTRSLPQAKQINESQYEQVEKEEKSQFVNNIVIEVNQMKSNSKASQNQLRQEIKLVKNIKIKQLKALSQTLFNQQPLFHTNIFQSQRHTHVRVPQSLPQMGQVENPDLDDLIDIFVKEEIEKIGDKAELEVNQSQIMYSSQSNIQKQLRNSHLKRFQDLQFTALSMCPQSKRRQSHTTVLSGLLSQSVWMSCEEQKEKPTFERKSSQKQHILQTKVEDSKLSKYGVQSLELQMGQSLNSVLFRKSLFDGQTNQKSTILLRQSKINEYYSKELQKYIQFKRTIEKRRESTLKQIQNSQQLIAKLIRSFKSNTKTHSVKKNQKQNNKERNYSSIKKTPNPKSKSNSKQKSGSKFNQPKISAIDQQDLFTQRNVDIYQQETSFKTIQIFSNYVEEKQKMDSNRQSPHKTNHYLRDPKKQVKKVNKVDSLLQTCKKVAKKQPRIELRVDLASKSAKQKQQIKNKTKRNLQARDTRRKNTGKK